MLEVLPAGVGRVTETLVLHIGYEVFAFSHQTKRHARRRRVFGRSLNIVFEPFLMKGKKIFRVGRKGIGTGRWELLRDCFGVSERLLRHYERMIGECIWMIQKKNFL